MDRKIKNDKISEATLKDLKYLFNKNEDIFLSLNYTPTLEMLYNINKNNIKYIHVVKEMAWVMNLDIKSRKYSFNRPFSLWF